MKKVLITGVLVTVMSVGYVYAEEPMLTQDLQQRARTGLTSSATSFSGAAQRANPAANVVYPRYVSPATAASASAITKTLSRGLKNDAQVRFLQTFLVSKGFLTATPDGNFGPMTEAAVKKFQTANGVSPLGIVGPQTRALIK